MFTYIRHGTGGAQPRGCRVSRQAVTAGLWPQRSGEENAGCVKARLIRSAWAAGQDARSTLARAARRGCHGLRPEARSHVRADAARRLFAKHSEVGWERGDGSVAGNGRTFEQECLAGCQTQPAGCRRSPAGRCRPWSDRGGEARKPSWVKEGWDLVSTMAGGCHAASWRQGWKRQGERVGGSRVGPGRRQFQTS